MKWTRLAAVLFVGLSAACGPSDQVDGDVAESVAAQGTANGPVDAEAAIRDFVAGPDVGNRPLAALNAAIVADPGASRRAALDHIASDDPHARIAAAYVLSIALQPEDADALAPLLAAESPAERVLAAAGMLAVGDGRAVLVLIDALAAEELIATAAHPLRAWELARFSLLSYTGQDFGLRAATTVQEAAAVAPEWEAWWSEAADSFEIVRAPRRFGP